MTKLHDKLNGVTAFGKKPFTYGKAKVSKDVNLWAGTWKPITKINRDSLELDGRGFKISEIDEFKLSREGLIKIFEEAST